LPDPIVVIKQPNPPQIIEIVSPGPQGGTAEVGVLDVVAGATISGHRAVKPLSSGKVSYASNTTPGDIDLPIWLTLSAAVLDAPLAVVTFGEVSEPSWSWTPGEAIFLSTNGMLTQTPPSSGFLLQVAAAIQATVLFWEPKVPVNLA
jgi:hypothetical protein